MTISPGVTRSKGHFSNTESMEIKERRIYQISRLEIIAPPLFFNYYFRMIMYTSEMKKQQQQQQQQEKEKTPSNNHPE